MTSRETVQTVSTFLLLANGRMNASIPLAESKRLLEMRAAKIQVLEQGDTRCSNLSLSFRRSHAFPFPV